MKKQENATGKTKVCRKCGEEKPLDEFEIDGGKIINRCLECYKKHYKENNIKNKEKLKEYNKRRHRLKYDENPEKYKKSSKDYRKNNPEKCKEIDKRNNAKNRGLWKRECPKCHKELEHREYYSYLKSIKQNRLCDYCSRQKTGLKNKGTEKSQETKDKISVSMTGIIFDEERGRKISIKLKGRNCWDWRIREIIHLECIQCHKQYDVAPSRKESHFCCRECQTQYYRISGKWKPRFNPKGCLIIDEYGKENGYNFQHALNGGEYFIKELKYWVDGYDIKQNVVIEYMEKAHNFPKNIEKDRIRRERIIEFLKCKFIEIYE